MKRHWKMYRKPERMAFDGQRQGAKSRSIGWYFTFEEWVKWWEAHLGANWFALRGCHRDQFCMARYNDIGPYAPWNVKCSTNANNCSERKRLAGQDHPNHRLTVEEVKNIYCSHDSPTLFAKKYKVSRGQISKIKSRLTWATVTADLGPRRYVLAGQGARKDLI